MNFPRSIYMKPKENGSIYWAIEEVLYEGTLGTVAVIQCTSEMDNACKNCVRANSCNILITQGKRLLEESGLK